MTIYNKYLVDPNGWQSEKIILTEKITSGFVFHPNDLRLVTMRISTVDNTGYLWLAGKSRNSSFEVPILFDTAKKMMKEYCDKFLYKTRHHIIYENRLWMIDVFEKNNEGVLIAQTEVETENEFVIKPPWLLNKINDKGVYSDESLLLKPYLLRKNENHINFSLSSGRISAITKTDQRFADDIIDQLFNSAVSKKRERATISQQHSSPVSASNSFFENEVLLNDDKLQEQKAPVFKKTIKLSTTKLLRVRLWRWIVKILDNR